MSDVPFVLLDIRGLVLRSLCRGEDPEGQLDPATGKVENSAGYGFSNFVDDFLFPVLKLTPPRRIIAVWEGGNSYRRGLFPDYKKKRSERVYTEYTTQVQEELMEAVETVFAYLGCTQCMVPGLEADDVLAHLGERLPGKKMLYTVDADLFQCVSEDLSVLRGDEFVTIDETDPTTVAVTKSLLGDSSDEYPGIKGFGPAKLEAILEEFGQDTLQDLDRVVREQTFDDVLDAYESATNSEAKKGLGLIYEQRQTWPLQYELARLHPELCGAERDGKYYTIKWIKRVPDAEEVSEVFNRYSLTTELQKLQPLLPVSYLVTEENKDEFEAHFLAEFDKTPFFSFDYESFDTLKSPQFIEASAQGKSYVDVLMHSITGMSVNYGENLQFTAYLSVDHKDTDNIEDTYLYEILDTVVESGKPLVAHNAPFEFALTDTNFEKNLPPLHDTRLMALYVDEDGGGRLKDLSRKWLKYEQETYDEVLKRCGVEDMQQVTGEQVVWYGCDDSAVTAQLYDLFHMILHLEDTWNFVRDREFPTNVILYEGFDTGIKIDYDRLNVLAAEDAATYDAGFDKCRGLLAEHCAEQVPDRANELYNDLSTYEDAKMREDGAEREAIDKKIGAMWERLLASTQYLPMVTSKKEVKFVPTPKQVTKVMAAIGLPMELHGVTPNKITETVVEISTFLEEEARDGGEMSAHWDKFRGLLAEVGTELKKREGPAYDVFYEFCIEVLSDGMADEVHGDELNLDSPNQMQQLLYCKLGLPIRVRSKVQHGSNRDKLNWEGSPGTDDKAIDFAIAQDCPVGDWRRDFLITFKEVKACHTRRKNYWKPYPLWQHPRDGNIHGSVSNAATVTHRFTSAGPNLLQLTSKDGGRVRTMIVPKKDEHVILSPDLNGEELRITASLSHDPVMVNAYVGDDKRDLHTITAAAISGTVLQRENPELLERLEAVEVNGLAQLSYEAFKEMHDNKSDPETAMLFKNIRKLAKTVNFLLIYVGGPYTLARNLGIPVETAEMFLEAAYNTFARLSPWQQESVEYAREHGYVITSYGNRRHLGPGLFSTDAAVRTRLERQAVNSQVQGCGSDIMKIIMSNMLSTNIMRETNASLIVAPYDEIAVSVPRPAAWEWWLRMKDIMTLTPPGHIVPQLPELKGSALNWGTCVELGAHPTEEQLNEMLDKQLAERAAA